LQQPSSSLGVQHSLRHHQTISQHLQHQHSLSSPRMLPNLPTVNSMPANFNCTLAGLLPSDGSELREGNCSTTASPRRGQHSNSSSMTTLLGHNNSGFTNSSPFASPASSEGAPSVRMNNNPFMGGGMASGFLPCGPLSDHTGGRDRDSGPIKEETGYFSADTLEAREYAARGGLMSNHMSNMLFGQTPSMQQVMQSNQRYGSRLTLPSLAMLSSFPQEHRASNNTTPLGSPTRHGGPG
jgi:hypothetical protein